jgi:carboxypeptidase Q
MRNLISFLLCVALAQAQAPDHDMFAKIRTEATDHSQVAPVFDMFTVTIGPRLTASPAHKRAAEYARDRLKTYGLSDARLEPWHFGRGWTLEKLTVEMIEPRYLPLIGYADAWSSSTTGEIVGAPVWIGGKSPEQVDEIRAKLKGAIVMTDPVMTNFVRKDRPQPSDPSYVPMSAAYATSVGQRPGGRGPTPAQRIGQSLREASAGVILKPSRGEHGTVFVTGRDGGAGAVPTVTLSAEH